MQMMTVLKPIAFDVVICMSQLFDYYLFSVSFSFLGYYNIELITLMCFMLCFLLIMVKVGTEISASQLFLCCYLCHQNRYYNVT